MQITVAGHHIEVTENLHSHVVSKLQKISSHFPEIMSVDVTLTLDNGKDSVVEMHTVYHGKTASVKVDNDDMYHAITQGRDKLQRILSDIKSSEKALRKDKSVAHQEPALDGDAEDLE
ncbi:MAG: ribosome-associated translation inhibitor RaiA [Aestuariibacter sp.]|nr:ribosome-associated translation inhibitor RaiA [Aestuariibacter sp.]|tara:strand:- start:258900 stop:259253 length:354 start_codon:yes stop_codon:yes gene_type:complete